MAEPFSIATGALQVAGAGISLAKTLYEYLESVKSAHKHVKAIAVEVRLTSSVLEHLGTLLKDNEEEKLCSQNVVSDAKSAFNGCEDAFREIDNTFKVLVKPQADGTKSVSVAGRLSWPFKKGKLETLQANLERLKTTLLLMLSVLSYAREKASKPPAPDPQLALEKLQIQNLIKAKDDATERYERLLYDFTSLATDDGHVEQADGAAGARAEARPDRGFSPNVTDATHAPNPEPPPHPALSLFRAPSDTDSSAQRDEVLTQLHMCTSAVSHLASTVNSAAVHWTQFRRLDDTNMMGSIRVVMQSLTQLRTMAKQGTAKPLHDTAQTNVAQQFPTAQVGILQQSTTSGLQYAAAPQSQTLTHQQTPLLSHSYANTQEAQEARVQEAQMELAQWRQTHLQRSQMHQHQHQQQQPVQQKPQQSQNMSGNHSLSDHQRQLMLLESQNKKRFLMSREEQSGMALPSGIEKYGQSIRTPEEEGLIETPQSTHDTRQSQQKLPGSVPSYSKSDGDFTHRSTFSPSSMNRSDPPKGRDSADATRSNSSSPQRALSERMSRQRAVRKASRGGRGGLPQVHQEGASREQRSKDVGDFVSRPAFALPENDVNAGSAGLDLDLGAAGDGNVLDSFDFEAFMQEDNHKPLASPSPSTLTNENTQMAQILDNSMSDKRENRVRIVDPPNEDGQPKGILKKPTPRILGHSKDSRKGAATDSSLLDFDGGQSAAKQKTSLRRSGSPKKSQSEDDIHLDFDFGLESSQPEKSVKSGDDFIPGRDAVSGAENSERDCIQSNPYSRDEKRYTKFSDDSQEDQGEDSSAVEVEQGLQPLETTPQSRDTAHSTRAKRDIIPSDRDVLLPLAPMKAMRQRVLSRKRSAPGPIKSAVSKKRKTSDTAYSHWVNADDINGEGTADTVDQTLGLLDSVDELIKRWTTVEV